MMSNSDYAADMAASDAAYETFDNAVEALRRLLRDLSTETQVAG